MTEKDFGEQDQDWRRIAAAFLRPGAGPSPVETEAFVSRVMSRLDERRAPAGLRWLVPAMSFALAASVGFMLLPIQTESLGPAETMLMDAPISDNPLALNLEE